ncbi:exosortase H [Cupriavidus sp. USMAA2-4]|uniref:exosortase H n=1 Tax=Cupriavidus sp. USMAA2-4 TaxID=876364 RepID=UPI0008A6D764|nr:exosortase H [Cupriavidus sp. USMAA2-4]AOY94737.1 exosortase H [Cupriavidus sp. USMAA2-4]
MRSFLVKFLLFLLVPFFIQLQPAFQTSVIAPFVGLLASSCAAIAQHFDAGVHAQGNLVLDSRTGNGISIEGGCSGVEVCLILAAAILAYPAPLRRKVAGLALGLAAIQLLNLVRLLTLFYLNAWSKPAFEFMHLYVWQGLIILDALVLWIWWSRSLAKDAAHAA